MRTNREKAIRRLCLRTGLGVGLACGMLVLFSPAFLEGLEFKTLDFRFAVRHLRRPPVQSKTITIVTIDEKSISEIGRWPWPRDQMAHLIDRLREAGAKVIGMDILFMDSGSDKTDRQLAGAIRRHGRVILPIVFCYSPQGASLSHNPGCLENAPDFLLDSAFAMVRNQNPENRSIAASALIPPLSLLGKNAGAFGHINAFPDSDGVLRREPLAVAHEMDYYPSFSLQVAREFMDHPHTEMALHLGERVQMGELSVPTDERGRLLIDYGMEFPRYSASDVLRKRVSPDAFAGHLVLVGGWHILGIGDEWPTPLSPRSPGVLKNAAVIENLLSGAFLSRPGWLKGVDLLVSVSAAVFFGMLLSRVKAVLGAATAIILLFGYLLFTQYAFEAHGVWMNAVYPMLSMTSSYTLVTLVRFVWEERQARQVRSIFASYVTPVVMEQLIGNPEMAKLGGERREMTALFADVKGFTTFSEKHSPEEVVTRLNELLGAMTDLIFHWKGTLNKFMGDGIMAFWGAPLQQENHAELAVRCALHMVKRLSELQKMWAEQGKEILDLGIGINSGEMLVGNMGAAGKKMDYTIIGDHVNLASRVEGLTRIYHDRILMTEFTYQQIKGIVDLPTPRTTPGDRKTERIGQVAIVAWEAVAVKGRAAPVTVCGMTNRKVEDPANL